MAARERDIKIIKTLSYMYICFQVVKIPRSSLAVLIQREIEKVRKQLKRVEIDRALLVTKNCSAISIAH